MEKYVRLDVVGEVANAIVRRCRHKDTGQLVAIKEFLVTEDDDYVRKLALREIRMLRKLQHDNLVNMIEAFRRKRKFHLVFEHMSHTVLDELQENDKGLGEDLARQYMFQIVRGVEFCHRSGIVHRNITSENILVSSGGVVKLCDFGLARMVSPGGESCTGNVGSRWYRAPELLVGDSKYGKPVDIWALGCLLPEIITGEPLFPGESEIDQLNLILSFLGKLCSRHLHLVATNPLLAKAKSLKLQQSNETTDPFESLKKRFRSWPYLTLDIVSLCLRLDPEHRATSTQLLNHPYFTHDDFSRDFLPEVRKRVKQEFLENPLSSKFYQQYVEHNMPEVESTESETPKPLTQAAVPRWKIKTPIEEENVKSGNRTLEYLYVSRKRSDTPEGSQISEEYDGELVKDMEKPLKYCPLKLMTCHQRMSCDIPPCPPPTPNTSDHNLQTPRPSTGTLSLPDLPLPPATGVMTKPSNQTLAELALTPTPEKKPSPKRKMEISTL